MLYFPFLWWLVVLHKSAKQMMDFQFDLEGWFEESTLFPNQPACYRSLYPESKDPPPISSIGDGWLDEKLDLSVFDLPDNWLEPQNDSSGKMIAEDSSISVILESLMGSNPVDHIIPVDEIEAKVDIPDLEDITCEVLACETVLPLEANASATFNEDPPGTPPIESLCETVLSPEENIINISFTEEPCSPPSEDFSSSLHSPTSSVCSSYSEPPLASLQEETPVTYKYADLLGQTYMVTYPKYDETSSQDGGDSDQSSVGPVFPASKKSARSSPYPTKKEARRERKKVQNKEAAARYRTKKRLQDKELGVVVQSLESEQKSLQDKHDQLKNEISYLKSLMREMFQRKGLL